MLGRRDFIPWTLTRKKVCQSCNYENSDNIAYVFYKVVMSVVKNLQFSSLLAVSLWIFLNWLIENEVKLFVYNPHCNMMSYGPVLKFTALQFFLWLTTKFNNEKDKIVRKDWKKASCEKLNKSKQTLWNLTGVRTRLNYLKKHKYSFEHEIKLYWGWLSIKPLYVYLLELFQPS